MTAPLFACESPRPAALMRIGTGLVLLWDALPRWPYVVELYSTAGTPTPLFPAAAFEPPALSACVAVALYALLLFSLLTVTLGWRTRLSLLIAFALSAWFSLLDLAGTMTKYTAIGQHLLLLLAFTQSHAVWSVDAWLPGNRRGWVKLSATWPRFLLRVMVSSIYLGAAVTKLRLPDFATGDLLMFSMLDDRWGGTWLGMWLATQPRLLVLASFATVLFEITAAVLLWIPRTRRPTLLAAFLFHLVIGLTMHVGVFWPMMIVALFAFLRESDLQRATGGFRRVARMRNAESPESRVGRKAESGKRKAEFGSRRNSQLSALNVQLSRQLASFALFVLIGAFAGGIGSIVQKSTGGPDPFRDNGPQRWTALEPAVVDEILIAEPPRPQDYLHRLEIGSRAGFRQLFGEREEFPAGSTIYALARLALQPRDALRLQWVLVDSTGKEWQRHATSPNPLAAYVSFAFDTSQPLLPAGRYEVVLEVNGKVAARKPFRIVSGKAR